MYKYIIVMFYRQARNVSLRSTKVSQVSVVCMPEREADQADYAAANQPSPDGMRIARDQKIRVVASALMFDFPDARPLPQWRV